MNCDRVAERMSSYLEGELPPDERARFDSHLESCPDCRELLDLMRTARAAMEDIPELEVPPALLHRLRVIPDRKSGFRASLEWLMRPALQPALGAAAIFMILLSFYAFSPERGRIQKDFDLKFHQGISRVERIWARAENLTQTLAGYTDGVLVSLRNLVDKNDD